MYIPIYPSIHSFVWIHEHTYIYIYAYMCIDKYICMVATIIIHMSNMCPSKASFLKGIKWSKKPLRIHAKSLSDALACSKKIACGASLRQLCEASAFMAKVPIVCQIFARKNAHAVVPDSERSHFPLGWSAVSISGTIPGLIATATAPSPRLNYTFSDH